MSTDRFHKAAKDGLIEILKEATRRDCNGKDEMGMTPTLYAAFNGNLEALRLLCGRGGDPDKADHFGNTALHLAAAQGHKAVVTFLVNFGANIYAMDIDERTPQELAGINNREDILRFLDGVHAKMEASDKKKVKSLKEKAKKDAEKRIKEYNKRQAKLEMADKLQRKYDKSSSKHSLISTLKLRINSGSMSNLSSVGNTAPRNSFSALVSGGGGTVSRNITSTVQRKALANKLKNNPIVNEDDFKISNIEDGKRSVSSIKGFRRDSEVMFNSTLENARRGRLDGVFNDNDGSDSASNPGTLTRSVSQPDFMQELNNNESTPTNHEPSSIFVRPGMGSLAFRKSISNTFKMTGDAVIEESSIGSVEPFDDYLSGNESSDDENPNGALERFLTAWGLREYLPRFDEQKIDLDTLMLLTENDLKSLNLPLGPYRKLVTAISERKSALENPGEVTDSML